MQNSIKMLRKIKIKQIFLVVLGLFLFPAQAYAILTPNSASATYEVNQISFGVGSTGSGSTPYDTSPTYEAQATVGDLAIGNQASATYQIYAGYNTTAAPYITCNVTSTSLSLGALSQSSTATGTATFYVVAWLAHGYIVQTDGTSPTDGYHNFSTPGVGTNAASAINTEQFGMNLEADTSPSIAGSAGPNNVFPFSHGAVVSPYGSTNLFAYNNGDTIAQSTQSSGSTIYTLSYIFNIGITTPPGNYNFNQSIVATGTY